MPGVKEGGRRKKRQEDRCKLSRRGREQRDEEGAERDPEQLIEIT
jgi:hypothetical protein